VEHSGGADASAEMLGVRCNRQQRLGHGIGNPVVSSTRYTGLYRLAPPFNRSIILQIETARNLVFQNF
jgi:hypothetical protein